jgi:hypothetical protein
MQLLMIFSLLTITALFLFTASRLTESQTQTVKVRSHYKNNH